MADSRPPSDDRSAARIDRLVRRLMKGRRLKVTPADADEREAILAAARLAGSREARPHMSPALRRKLGAMVGVPPAPEPRPSWVTRRTALGGAMGLAAGVVASVGGGQLVQALRGTPDRTPEPTTSTGATPTPRPVFQPSVGVARWTDAGFAVTDLTDGVPRRVVAGAVEAFVVRREDQVSALSAYCTHFPCELVWKSDQRVLLCPCHNRSFTTDGVSADAAYPLPPLPLVQVRVSGGRVQVLGT